MEEHDGAIDGDNVFALCTPDRQLTTRIQHDSLLDVTRPTRRIPADGDQSMSAMAMHTLGGGVELGQALGAGPITQ